MDYASNTRVAGRRGAGGTQTGLLVIDENIDRFKRDVHTAMRDASAKPPNYYALGRLSGNCNARHRRR